MKLNETANISYRPCVDVSVGNESSTNECHAGVSVSNLFGLTSFVTIF